MNILTEKKNLELNAKYLEELITSLTCGEDEHNIFKSMKKTLSRMIDDECEEILIEKNSENEIFGMSVYLEDKSMHDLSRLIIDTREKPKDVTKFITRSKLKYVIEIDNRILLPANGFKPDEITAMLLHEIGHVLGDSDFYNDMKEAYSRATFENKDEIVKDTLNDARVQLGMVYMISVMQNTHMSKFTPIEKEQLADKFVADCGYGEALVRTFDKFTRLNNNKMVKRNIEDSAYEDAKINVMIRNNFKTRRKYIEEILDTEIKSSKSGCVSSLLSKIKKKLSSFMLHECVEGVNLYNYYLDESFMDLFNRNPIKVSQSDLDNLKIEIEMMEDFDDKSCVVYKIHKRITQLEKCKANLNPADRDYKTNLSYIYNYINQLNMMLKQTMKFKVQEKSYGVFIKYPKGYEG